MAPPAPTPARPVLEFDVSANDLARLLRSPALIARRVGRPRTSRLRTVWHDTANGALQRQGLAMAEEGGQWRLERLTPNGKADWLPAAPSPVLARAGSPGDLGCRIDSPLVPVAAFTGTLRSFALSPAPGGARLDVVEGDLRGVAHDEPACRVVLAGPAADMSRLAEALAAQATLRVPRSGLAAGAIALARGTAPAPRHLGTPHVPPGLTVDEALVLITAHLADVILHWSATAPLGVEVEPVHQMRVAVRRLRSALSVFRRAAPGSAIGNLTGQIKALAGLLGEARDWDVFLAETGAAVQLAFPQDRRISGLIAAAARRRAIAYQKLGAYLGSAEWHRLALSLALLPTTRPWASNAAEAPDTDMLTAPAASYAAQALQRAYKHMLAAGDDLSALPAEALHDVRKRAKKFRYSIEFFTPLFPAKAVRQFVDRLVDLQTALGTLNDGAVAAALMARLAGGADRAFAAGVVQGYVAALQMPAAESAWKAWRKLSKHETFWH
jgi:CHAD domain-containing protein